MKYLNMLNRFLEIGFKLKSEEITNSKGVLRHYHYKPDYLNGDHYTLVTFKSSGNVITMGYDKSGKMSREVKPNTSTDFRLYIHNSDGKYVSSLIQISDGNDWNRNYINEKIDEIFKSEIRQNKLAQLL